MAGLTQEGLVPKSLQNQPGLLEALLGALEPDPKRQLVLPRWWLRATAVNDTVKLLQAVENVVSVGAVAAVATSIARGVEVLLRGAVEALLRRAKEEERRLAEDKRKAAAESSSSSDTSSEEDKEKIKEESNALVVRGGATSSDPAAAVPKWLQQRVDGLTSKAVSFSRALVRAQQALKTSSRIAREAAQSFESELENFTIAQREIDREFQTGNN